MNIWDMDIRDVDIVGGGRAKRRIDRRAAAPAAAPDPAAGA
jgi:hypothetical protein